MGPDMGGMGGMGGQEPPKEPPQKQIGVKTARKFMKEVISAVSAEKIQKELETAHAAKEGAGGPKEAMQTIGPIVEKAVAGLVEKYKFEAGFGQAVMSVHEAQKR